LVTARKVAATAARNAGAGAAHSALERHRVLLARARRRAAAGRCSRCRTPATVTFIHTVGAGSPGSIRGLF
jgi:hypothetical protein